MDYGNLKVPKNATPEVQAILDSYEARNKEIERNHKKEMAKLYGGAALQIGSALIPGTLGLKAAGGAIKALTPYVATGLGGGLYELGQGIMEGDKAPELLKKTGIGAGIGAGVGAVAGKALPAFAKSKAGQAIGNQASKLYNSFANTKIGQKVTEIAPKVEDLLMTDIKAFNPFKQTQTAYHGSPYDFTKFSNETIGTGEGAQAHGRGHYAAKNKDVAEGYRKRLSARNTETDIEELKDLNKGFKYNLLARGKEDTLNKLNELIEANKNNSNKLQEFQKYKNIVENFNDNTAPTSGQLYKLSIPKDDVMLREGADSYTRQPKVQKALNQLFEDTGLYKEWDEANSFNRRKKFATDETILYDIQIDLGKTPQEANDLLNNYGIKGISYNGGIDGEANVIFNPDDIEIVRKYYNQPNLYDYLMKNSPNIGAATNAIEDILRNPIYPMGDGFKNYEKLGLDYYKNNLQPNPVEIEGYGTVHFGKHNRGKDDITNFRVYPDLREQLMGATRGERTNYNDEADRMYDYFYNTYKGDLYKYLIEDIEGLGKRYKKMRNMRTNK